MAKFDKGTVLPAILLCYTAIMGVIIFPHFRNAGKLLPFICLIAGAVFLSLLLAYLFKRQKAKKK